MYGTNGKMQVYSKYVEVYSPGVMVKMQVNGGGNVAELRNRSPEMMS